MSIGLFPAASSHGLPLKQRNQRLARKKLDDFAELLAEGKTPATAAVELGHLPSYGRVLLARICEQLGPQAT